MNVLPTNLRDRAQSILSRFEIEAQTKKEKEEQEKLEIKNLATEDFKAFFKTVISEEVINSLDIRVNIKDCPNTCGWKILSEGAYQGYCSHLELSAKINLPYDCFIKVQAVGSNWKIIKPSLNVRKNQWSHPEVYGYVDLDKLSLEEAILTAILEFEHLAQEYCQAVEQEEQERIEREGQQERQRIEKEQYRAQVEAEDAEIRALIEKAIAPYYPSWPDGFILRVYKWRYCTGAVDGDFNYEDIYSLSPHMSYDNELDKSFVVTVEGDRIALEMEAHKPVVHEIVCDSLDCAQKKLSCGFCMKYSLLLTGVSQSQPFLDKYPEDYCYYWSWGGKGQQRFWNDTPGGKQMKPWLRELLGLPKLPSTIHIQR